MSRRWSRPRSRSARAALAACVAVAALGTAAPGAAAGVLASACTGREQPPDTYRHVLVIVMENHSASQIFGSPKTPYITKVARRCGKAVDYRAITHPSLPNYIAMTAGSTGGIVTDCNACRTNVPDIFRQLVRRGRSWRGYEESMPSPCLRADSGRYLMRHNPAVYFRHLGGTCPTSDLPMGTPAHGALRHALRKNMLPAFAFLTPDACHDMHDCPKSVGDAWVRSWLPMILRNQSYRNGQMVVFLTFDEGVGADQRVATVVLSPYVAAGTASGAPFTHYSLLRTTENLLGLPLLGHARTAVGMRRAFGL
jgi:phosphatidylinositol-3-phosphatase